MIQPYKKPNIEIADIFKKYKHLIGSRKASPNQTKAINAIINCRTGVLGGHQLKCNSCDYKKQAYNSCRNRHCPKCQFTARQKWIESRTEDLLPCKYFHVVFTVPSELRPLILRNKKAIYDILFKASSETLKEVAKTQFKSDIGFFGVLHTWSQTLVDHPHVHYVVPGGGLNKEKDQWIPCSEKYLLPVKILSKVFRAKFLEKIENSYNQNKLIFPGQIEQLSHPGIFRELILTCTQKSFNVDIRKPFSGPKAVIRYLGAYTHRIAISNHRIIKVDNNFVYFKYRDPNDPSKKKVMKLHVKEFMRRFLLHVLPTGLVRIRHYGILSSRVKNKNASLIKQLCKVKHCFTKKLEENWKDTLNRLTGVDPDKCPNCDTGMFEEKKSFASIFSTA